MTYYNPEPQRSHADSSKVGILIINLGTPTAPTTKSLRSYLSQFLSDRRVVELPRLLWWSILHGIILRIRPKQSAKKYAHIWQGGSPLLIHTKEQVQWLQQELMQKYTNPIVVTFGMTYGHPSIASALQYLKNQYCERILLFPLYPQYAGSSTGSAFDAVWRVLLRTRNVPEIRTIRHYHRHPAYIRALANSVRQHWHIHGTLNADGSEKLIMSFHGVPKFHCTQGDPYSCECQETAYLLAEELNLTEQQYRIAFQSRFGQQEWLQPYLSTILTQLGKEKINRLDIICPGFSSDCLETLEEIALEGKAIFTHAGGGAYHYIPALNENVDWIQAMTEIVADNLHGWATERHAEKPH